MSVSSDRLMQSGEYDGDNVAQRWAAIERAFTAALDTPPDARAAFLAGCSDDPAIRREVERLLARHESLEASDGSNTSGGFLSPLDRTRAARLVDETDNSPARIGRYDIRRLLGRGAFGDVYLAFDPQLDRLVAIKRLAIHLGTDGPWVRRFADEARAASRLAHPHIVTVHDIARDDDGRLFIVMAYEGGDTLRDALANGPLPLDEAVRYAAEVADGLAAAHAAGLVHRDIKPENILRTPRGARITDFGIAKDVDVPVSLNGAIMGTPAYMSPEQTRGADVDRSADLWSLGVVLFELLTGTRPFPDGTLEVTVHAIRHDDAPAPSSRRRDVPAALDALVARCLSRDPSRRFASADELRDALRNIQRGISRAGVPDAQPSESATRRVVTPVVVAALFVAATFAWTRGRSPDRTAMNGAGVLTTASAPLQTLAVLPLQPVDTNVTFRPLGFTITESIRTQLAATPGLRLPVTAHVVATRRAGGGPADIGRRLGADAVLTGTIRRSGDDVIIDAALLRSSRGDTLWRGRVQRPLPELARLEQEIVTSVATALGAAARPWRQPDPMAYELYLRGRRALNRWNETTLEESAMYFREAIARDSGFARAWLGLSATLTALQSSAPAAERFRMAKPLVARALAAEPNLAEAHKEAAWIAMWYDHDWLGAERHYLRALELDPSDIWTYHGYAALLSATGRPDSAVAITRQAMPLDPQAASTITHLSIHLNLKGRHDEAIALLESVLARDSVSWPRAFLMLGRTYLAAGRNEDALRLLRRHAPQYAGLEARGALAHALGVTGRTAEAKAMLASMELEAKSHTLGAVNLVVGYAGLGDTARALDWLERVPDDRGHMFFLLAEPSYDALRGSARWKRVIDRLGLSAADTVTRIATYVRR